MSEKRELESETVDIGLPRTGDQPTHVVTPDSGPGASTTLIAARDNGHYTVGEEIARGGLGRIIIGYDQRLERSVAIKELIARDPDSDKRFLREARLTALLQHPSIVPIYDTDHWPDGKPFYAMKLIRGRSFAEVIAQHPTLRERLSLLPTVLAVAEAIAYAHDKRIIHRDIKPANVVVGSFGETVVIDWGLAKSLDESGTADREGPYRTQSLDVTVAGAVVGTPPYMPPEQANGDPVDTRADVYALGAMLYHTLSGVAPYEGKDTDNVLERVRTTAPIAIEQRAPGVPADLAAIVHRAMSRDPAARYPDGSAFAEDLRRFLSGQLVAAHRYSRSTRLLRFVARHRTSVALTTTFTLLLGVLGALAVARIVRERDRAEARSNEMILAGARATLERNPTATLAWLKQYPLSGSDWEELRGLALEALGEGVSRQILWPMEWVSYPALAPDGKRYVTQGATAQLEIRDLASGRVLRTLAMDDDSSWRLHWSADGRRIVGEHGDKAHIRVWDLDTGARRIFPEVDTDASADLSPDGSSLAIGGIAKVVRLIDLGTGTTRELGTLPAEVADVYFFDAGRQLAAAGVDGTVELWSLSGGPPRVLHAGGKLEGIRVIDGGQRILAWGKGLEVIDVRAGTSVRAPADVGYVMQAAVSPDGGTLVASVGTDRALHLWDRRGGTVRTLTGHERSINRVAFSPDGRLIATGSRDATIRLWDVQSGESQVLRGHTSQVVSVLFSQDGGSLISVSADRSTRVWTVPRDLTLAMHVHIGESQEIALLDDDHVATTGWEDGQVKLSELSTQKIETIAQFPAGAAEVVASADGRTVVSTGRDIGLSLWSRDGAHASQLSSLGVTYPMFSCDGRSLAAAVYGKDARIWDLASGKERVVDAQGGGGRVVYSPDCRVLVTQSPADHALHVVDVASGNVLRTMSGHTGYVTSYFFSPDGKQLLSASEDKSIRLWTLANGESRLVHVARDGVLNGVQTADRRFVALGDFRGDVHLWDFTGGRYRTLSGHTALAFALTFSPDGELLMSGSADHTLRLWDVTSAVQLQSISTGATVTGIVFTLDGKQVMGVDNTGLLRRWRVERVAPATRERAALQDWLVRQTAVVVMPDRSLSSP